MNKKIIIGLLIAILVAGIAAAVILNNNNYEKKTIEIFENGTSMTVPATVNLTNRSDNAVNFDDKENTTPIVAFRFDDENNFLNINSLLESIVDEYIHNVTDNAELQDNGVFKLSADERKKIAAQTGINIKDKKDAKDLYIGVLKNESLNQTIIIVSENEQYVVDMMDSVKWKAPSKIINKETKTIDNTPKSNKSVEEPDPETGYNSTFSGVSAENNLADYPEYEESEDNSLDEVTYGEEQFNG